MITFEQARALVEQWLSERSFEQEHKRVIDDRFTEETEVGWIFYLTTQRYLETGDTMFKPMGGRPILVTREDGELQFLTHKRPPDRRG